MSMGTINLTLLSQMLLNHSPDWMYRKLLTDGTRGLYSRLDDVRHLKVLIWHDAVGRKNSLFLVEVTQ